MLSKCLCCLLSLSFLYGQNDGEIIKGITWQPFSVSQVVTEYTNGEWKSADQWDSFLGSDGSSSRIIHSRLLDKQGQETPFVTGGYLVMSQATILSYLSALNATFGEVVPLTRLESGRTWEVCADSVRATVQPTEEIMGIPVARTVVSQPSDAITIVAWIAPDLNCFPLRTIETFQGAIVRRIDPLSVKRGAPDAGKLLPPAESDLVDFQEVDRRHRKAFGTPALPEKAVAAVVKRIGANQPTKSVMRGLVSNLIRSNT
jgi:hypothetical protein